MFNAQRLTIARRRRRMTVKELAERAGVSALTITRLENGQHQPEPSTAAVIASALDYPPAFFAGGELEEPLRDGVSFRSLTAMTAREREAAIAAGALAFLLADWAAERFNLPTADLIDASQERDPAGAARWLRQHWGLGEQPISGMVRLLEAKGVRVFSLAEETRNVDAFSCWRGNIPFVFLNTFKSAEHSRFDAAHELGHLVLHKHGGPNQGRAAEMEAQLFAASFLMPEADVRSRMPRARGLDDLITAKRRWGVSVAALAYRLHKLGILTDWVYRGMVIEMSRRGYRTAEPAGLPREESVVWKKVFGEMWKDRVTKGHIAEQLHLPAAELENLVFGLTAAARPQKATSTNGAGLRLVGA